MKIKELMRVLIYDEMRDIISYSAEADVFGETHLYGDRIRDLFSGLAREKHKRLKEFDKVSDTRTGFRQRKTEPPRSIEASLRTHITATENSIALYGNLVKLLKNLEHIEYFKAVVERDRQALAELKALQAVIKEKI
ncbi:MAG TPA: hypothetical protein PKI19_04230 [Elusimicrobiales bacterium]|nr:hypothetical protein [Elusimicrobiales bacterium]